MTDEAMSSQKATELWQEFLQLISGSYSTFTYNFFACMKPLSFDNGTITLAVENGFIEDWVQSNNYAPLIRDELSKIVGSPVNLNMVIAPQTAGHEKSISRKKPNNIAQKDDKAPDSRPPEAKPVQKSKAIISSLFDKRYTFDTFIGDPSSNALALAAAQAVAAAPGERYNPLYIYGPSGLGKTHLLHAIGQKIAASHPDWSIVYLSTNEFLDEYIGAMRDNKMSFFNTRYHKICQVLLMDDIQFIAGNKTATQNELFNIFNTMKNNGKQLVFASDKLPHDMPDIPERLRSRFQSGLLADIQVPALETKVAILQKKASTMNLKLSQDVAFYIASALPSNVRTLEGALQRLSLESARTGRSLSTSYAKELLVGVYDIAQGAISVADVTEAVSEFYHLDPKLLTSGSRTKELVRPRQLAMYLCYKHLPTSYPALAKDFKRKDHTTIMSACRKIESLIGKSDAEILEAVNAIEKLLRRS